LATVSTVLNILAAAGIAAAAWHLVRAAFRFLRAGATGLWAEELGRTHARRGDLTSLEESERDRSEAARSRSWHGVEALAWLVVLVAPVLTPWATALYAVCALLWLVPVVRGAR
jgi:hypothetical protein